jgi:predicted nucleic acid-binding protein
VDFYYFDASVLVKAYIWEVGTEDVRQVLRAARSATPTARIFTSRIAYAEAMSAVSRREAALQLTSREAAEIARQLQADYTGPVAPFVVFDPGRSVIHYAAKLARQHRLRALDAIHLATALSVRFNMPSRFSFQFGSADKRLNVAAGYEGLSIFNPQSAIPTGIVGSVVPPL